MSDGISTISDFYKVAQEKDFSRKNQIRVLSINSGAGLNVSFSPDDLVYAKTAKIPTRKINTSEAKFMGLAYNIPGTVVYEGSDDYKINFYADQKFDLWSKFSEWTREVFDDETSSGNYFTPKASATITLLLLDNNLEPVKTITLVGVVCKSVGEVEYDITGDGEVQSFDASFSYHFWTSDN